MGSLMAGWDSRVRDPKAVTYQRNRSFTKGEIDAYWRTKKKIEEEHLKAISDTSDTSQESTFKEESAGIKLQRSSSLPLANTKERFMENIIHTETDLEKLLQKNGWWTRSNSAYLNEPPVIGPEGASHKYAAQFHVAGLSASKANPVLRSLHDLLEVSPPTSNLGKCLYIFVLQFVFKGFELQVPAVVAIN